MKKKITAFLFLALLLCPTLHADTTPLVVVSCRQYLVKGDSTIHLYLYDLNGKLLKQLTNDAGQDDHAPMFAPDGKSIIFTRTTTGAGAPDQSGKYLLALADNSMSRFPDTASADKATQAYAPTIPTTEFGNLAFSDNPTGQPDPADGSNAMSLSSPDKNYTLIQLTPPDPDASATYKLKTAASPKPKLLSSFAGYKPDSDAADGYLASSDGPFLLGPSHYGALFVNRHRDTMWVVDLNKKAWHELQSEWVPGDIYAPQNKSGFFFVRCSMLPLGDTGKTVLCAFLEWWNAKFQRVILNPPLSVIYGATFYFGPNQTASFVDEQRGS
jgi:hypothetical protein